MYMYNTFVILKTTYFILFRYKFVINIKTKLFQNLDKFFSKIMKLFFVFFFLYSLDIIIRLYVDEWGRLKCLAKIQINNI